MKDGHILGEFICNKCWNFPSHCICGGFLHSDLTITTDDLTQAVYYECDSCGNTLTHRLKEKAWTW